MTEEEYKNYYDNRFFTLFKHGIYMLYKTPSEQSREYIKELVRRYVNCNALYTFEDTLKLPEAEISAEEKDFYLDGLFNREQITDLLQDQMCANWYGYVLEYDPSLSRRMYI